MDVGQQYQGVVACVPKSFLQSSIRQYKRDQSTTDAFLHIDFKHMNPSKDTFFPFGMICPPRFLLFDLDPAEWPIANMLT